jgi:hypothetical protein
VEDFFVDSKKRTGAINTSISMYVAGTEYVLHL